MRIDIISSLFIVIVALSSVPLSASKSYIVCIIITSHCFCCSSQCWFSWSSINLCYLIEWNVSVLCETKC